MANRDYYDVLGISKTGTDEDIRKAFRKKAMEYHPDRNKNSDAEAKFKEINEAYQVLSDPNKRAQYNRFGAAGVGSNGGDRPFEGSDVFGGFGDIFDSFFGDATGRRTREAQRGSDIQQNVVLTFEESVFGAEREVEINRLEKCQKCSGQGNEPGTPINTCATCRGNGQVRRAQRSVFGQFTQVTACAACQGRGSTIVTPCQTCRGGGLERRQRKISVRIPAGVEAGMQVRLSGEGEAGQDGGSTGNLYVYVDVRAHEFFQRDDSDLIYEMPITYAEAVLGTEKEVPTLDSNEPIRILKIPQGTQHGAEFRIKDKGIPHIHSNRRGDLRVVVDLQVPRKLNEEQRQALEAFAQTLSSGIGVKDAGGSGSQSDDSNPGSDGQNQNGQPGSGHSKDDDKGLFNRIKDVLG